MDAAPRVAQPAQGSGRSQIPDSEFEVVSEEDLLGYFEPMEGMLVTLKNGRCNGYFQPLREALLLRLVSLALLFAGFSLCRYAGSQRSQFVVLTFVCVFVACFVFYGMLFTVSHFVVRLRPLFLPSLFFGFGLSLGALIGLLCFFVPASFEYLRNFLLSLSCFYALLFSLLVPNASLDAFYTSNCFRVSFSCFMLLAVILFSCLFWAIFDFSPYLTITAPSLCCEFVLFLFSYRVIEENRLPVSIANSSPLVVSTVLNALEIVYLPFCFVSVPIGFLYLFKEYTFLVERQALIEGSLLENEEV